MLMEILVSKWFSRNVDREKRMSRMGITFEDVSQAAEAILQEGASPTIDKIRQHLGSTGSNTTISKYLNDWRNHYFHSATLNSVKNVTPDPVKSAVERVWQEMNAQASAEISAMKEKMEANALEAEQKLQLVCDERDALKEQHEALVGQHRQMTANHEILTLDFKALQEERKLWQERNKGLEERYADLHRMTSQHLKDLSDTHKSEITRLDDSIKLAEAAHRQLVDTLNKQYENERHQYMITLDSLRTENQNKEEVIGKLQNSLQDKKTERAEMKLMIENLTRERNDLAQRIAIQENKWSLIEQNKKMTEEIFSSVKSLSITNFDMNVSYANLFQSYDNILKESLLKVNDVTDRLSTTVGLVLTKNEWDKKHER